MTEQLTLYPRVLLSSKIIDYQTPPELFEKLNREFNFDFDPCPKHNGGIVPYDGLITDWGERNFANPPYGRRIVKWLKKAYEEYQKGKLVVLLIPSRTDTRWWHEYIMKATEIRFVKGRIKFGGATDSAPFSSCIVVFDPSVKRESPIILPFSLNETEEQ